MGNTPTLPTPVWIGPDGGGARGPQRAFRACVMPKRVADHALHLEPCGCNINPVTRLAPRPPAGLAAHETLDGPIGSRNVRGPRSPRTRCRQGSSVVEQRTHKPLV